MAYTRTTWQNYPGNTPVNATRLNNVEQGLVDAHNFIVICTSTTRPASPFAGQQIYETNTGYMRVYDGTLWRQASPAPTVTSLPASPVDGDEVVYTADATAGIRWHFKYRAASASSYKWEFVGGASLIAGNASGGYGVSDIGPTTTFVQTLSGSPSITLPLAGDYRARVTAVGRASSSVAAPGLWLSFGGATCPSWAYSDSLASGTAVGSAHPLAANKTGTVTAGQTVTLNYTNANLGGSATFYNIRLDAVPERVG